MFIPFEHDVKKFKLKQENWVNKKKLFKINQLGSPFQVCICTDVQLNDSVANCDCKQIAEFRITQLTVKEWLKINTECSTYICSKFLFI